MIFVKKIKLWTLETFVWQQEQFNTQSDKIHSNDRRWYASSYTSNEQMNTKLITYIFFGVVAVVGWNVFLIQRDESMFQEYYRRQAIENIKQPPSNTIK